MGTGVRQRFANPCLTSIPGRLSPFFFIQIWPLQPLLEAVLSTLPQPLLQCLLALSKFSLLALELTISLLFVHPYLWASFLSTEIDNWDFVSEIVLRVTRSG